MPSWITVFIIILLYLGLSLTVGLCSGRSTSRGTDIFKALALGATAVGVGRPYLWGLASFGQAGVEAVLQMLRRELELVMRQAGTRTIKDIKPAHILNRTL